MKVAILYIAIGQYSVFFDSFYRSCEKYFMPDSMKDYFVFSDNNNKAFERENVKFIETVDMGWPDNTLKRFHLFTSIEDKLMNYDYCFFFNANLEFVKTVSENILPTRGIVVVQHPGHYSKQPTEFPYDRNESCLAYIPQGEGRVYVCGGVNGGCTSDYLKMCNELKRRVDVDYANGVVAKWHDESQLNRYIHELDEEEFVVWHPGFCYPDFYRMPFDEICHLKEKSYYIKIDRKKKRNIIDAIYMFLFTKQRFFTIKRFLFRKNYERMVLEGNDLGCFVDCKKRKL